MVETAATVVLIMTTPDLPLRPGALLPELTVASALLPLPPWVLLFGAAIVYHSWQKVA